MKTLCLSLLLFASTALAAAAQTADDFRMPDDLAPFWKKYYEAKQADDEPEMDKVVRTYKSQAIMALDLLLDDVSVRERAELPTELRTLAWSLDRVDGQTRYIERVRYVLDLSLADRRSRREAMIALDEAFKVLNDARFEKSEDGWARSAAAFEPVLARFQAVGDLENQVLCLRQLAETERARGHRWELSKLLKQLVEAGEKLPYKDIYTDEARGELGMLKAQGIDPDGPRPDDADTAPPAGGGDAADGADGADGGPGRGFTSFKAGAAEQAFPLELVPAKKGLGSVVLPTFSPPEQFYLWDWTFVKANGPSEFRGYGTAELKPFGNSMNVTRDGMTFGIDTNGDGSPEVEFTPNSTPQLVELPSADGTRTYPVMLAAPSDRESMFGLDVNYSIQPETARLRFGVGGWTEGKVLGETWKLYDSNLTGAYGDEVAAWGDGKTRHSDELPHVWYDVDSVLIGKATVAQPFSPVLPVKGVFYRASVDADGTGLTLREMNLATGFIKLEIDTAVQPTHLLVREMDKLEGSVFNVVPEKKGGTVAVPAGTYELAGGRLEKGKKTSMKQARIYKGRSETFTVEPGETKVLTLGAPFTLEAVTHMEGESLVVPGRSLRVFGRGGEEYAMLFDDALQPDVEVTTPEGKRIQKAEKMHLADISAWEKDPDVMWFPLDMVVEVPKGEKAVAHLSQKTHVLLGGPMKSPEEP